MVEVSDEEFKQFLEYKKTKYLTTNDYPLKIAWEKMVFKYNPYLSKGIRNSSQVKCFIKQFESDRGISIQLQMWYGKTPYIFDVLDATKSQEEYNILKNKIIKRVISNE